MSVGGVVVFDGPAVVMINVFLSRYFSLEFLAIRVIYMRASYLFKL